MITNERQYRIAKARVKDAQRVEEQVRMEQADKPAPVREAYVQALKSNVASIREEIQQYERLRQGGGDLRALGLAELPGLLIKARIARGLTQRALAKELRVPEQQVQRWEAHEYHGVAVERLAEIAEVLGVLVEERVQSPREGPVVTRREQQILRRIADGRTGHEVAAELGISTGTVLHHLRGLVDRLTTADEAEPARSASSKTETRAGR